MPCPEHTSDPISAQPYVFSSLAPAQCRRDASIADEVAIALKADDLLPVQQQQRIPGIGAVRTCPCTFAPQAGGSRAQTAPVIVVQTAPRLQHRPDVAVRHPQADLSSPEAATELDDCSMELVRTLYNAHNALPLMPQPMATLPPLCHQAFL